MCLREAREEHCGSEDGRMLYKAGSIEGGRTPACCSTFSQAVTRTHDLYEQYIQLYKAGSIDS